MDTRRHVSRSCIIGIVALVVLTICPQRHLAQERKVQNRPYIDMRRWHYGFLFGLHMQDLEFTNNGCVHTLEDGTQEFWFTDVAAYNPGFSVGVLGELYLTKHLSLRFIPTMHFGDKMVYFREQLSGAVEKQNIREAFGTVTGGPINLWGDNQPADVPLWAGLDVDEVTDYLKVNQKLMLENLKKTDRNSREVAMLPLMPQFRTTCHILGDYSLQVDDVYKHFDDSVCAINDFEHRDYLWEVPLRTLCRRDYPNMMTAGRSASGDGYAWDLLRVIPPAIITGQAIAEAASLAIRDGVGVADVNIKKLQAKLEAENVMIHFPDEYVPEDKTIILHGKNAAEISGGHF